MEANKCFGRRRVEEECPRSASEKTSPLTARCAVSKGSARATASSAICAGKSITKSLPSAKRRSVKPPAKEAIRTETQKPVICRIAGFLFAQNLSFFRADLRRNAVSNLRFSSVIYVLVNSLGKSSFSSSCLPLRTETAFTVLRDSARSPLFIEPKAFGKLSALFQRRGFGTRSLIVKL